MSHRGPGLDLLPSRPSRQPRRRAPGPRTRRLLAQRRERRRRQALLVTAVSVAVTVAVLAAGFVIQKATGFRLRGAREQRVATAPTQETWVLVGTVASNPSGEADWLSVLSWDRKLSRGFLMYVPRSTLVEVPGHGQDTLARAFALGREPLLLSTMANLFGISFDHHLEISDQGVQALFDKMGGVTLAVEQKLTRAGQDGLVRVVFAEGRQHLNGQRVAEYLRFVDESGDEISRGVRHAAVWSALWERFRAEGGPEALGKAFASSRDLFDTDAKPADLERIFGAFASVEPAAIQFETMPVRAIGVATGAQMYAPEREGVEAVVTRYLAGSRPNGAGRPGRRVEILNGNGRPGIGQEVSDLLIPKGFRIVLNQNAKSFDYERTQIVVYSGSQQALAIAEEVRSLLGGGEILVSRQRQSLVDVTIVVGHDYLRAKR